MTEKLAVLLARIDERTLQMQKALDDIAKKYVTREEFEPVRKIVYAGAGIILASVFGALVTLVVVH